MRFFFFNVHLDMGEHLIGTLCGICWAEDFGGYILLLQCQQVQCIVMKVILSASTAHGYSVVRCQTCLAQCLVTSIDKNSVSLCCGIHKHSVLSRAVKSLL